MKSAKYLGSIWLAAAAVAGPPLTTIQDTLFKADGTRFSGIVQVQWSSFEASDRSQIATQSLTVKVVDGVLRVKLVPTTNATPAAYYLVKYNSDGRVQFTETWAVPPSAITLRVRDVRITASSGTRPVSDAIEQSEIVGLVADLSARPAKSPGYAAGRAAVINGEGLLEAATGSASDCVRVDGSSGPCGESGATEALFVDSETPAGLADGANRVYTLSAAPSPAASLEMYRNGIRQKADFDFTLSGNTVQFVTGAVPQPGDVLLASFRVAAGGAAGGWLAPPAPEVVCSAAGAATSCALPPLVPGDRVEVRFDYEVGAGSSVEVAWGGTVLAQRTATAGGAITGRAEIAVSADGARWSSQMWGGGSLQTAADTAALQAGPIEFRGSAVRAFTVVRYPARQ